MFLLSKGVREVHMYQNFQKLPTDLLEKQITYTYTHQLL